MIIFLFSLGIFLQGLLTVSKGVVDFTLIRMIQAGLVAATIPLTFSLFVTTPKGGIIGFLNSARFAGNALGPMIATSVLAFSSLGVLYLSISALSLLALIGFKFLFRYPLEIRDS
jgi:hypothetical protein